MSYKESRATCDWCKTEIDSNRDIACKACHEELEEQVAYLEGEIKELRRLLEERT